MQRMVGATMGPGWRQAIERALGSVRGCTHLRELLFNIATAAYQTIPRTSTACAQAGTQPGDKPPPGQMHRLGFRWAVVQPLRLRWQPLKRKG
jgi:hypothetical protein